MKSASMFPSTALDAGAGKSVISELWRTGRPIALEVTAGQSYFIRHNNN
jgi:hypothetical protein